MAAKMVYSGAFAASFLEASNNLARLSDLSISAERIRRACQRAGSDRIEQQGQLQEAFQTKLLPERCHGKPADVEPPEIACIMADGGRYQVLDRSRSSSSGRSARRSDHWKESRIGLLASMSGDRHENDPQPELPSALRYEAVAEKLSDIGKTGAKLAFTGETELGLNATSTVDSEEFPGPTLQLRGVVASGQNWEDFGRLLASQAWYHGFAASARKVFVSDGSGAIEKLQGTHFSEHTSVLDILHALSYSLAAARAVSNDEAAAQHQYDIWAEKIWKGSVREVIEELKEHSLRIGEPPPNADTEDPRQIVRASYTYYTNHAKRMNYPHYRREGFPLTSSLMESTVKQVSRRVKGSEKYWSTGGGEVMLRLRGEYLSDGNPMGAYWTRRSRYATGMRTYRRNAHAVSP
ncbi:MAG: hypothetical protein JW818_08005 [Pirellulales bacterium]|nr:hypothetical protein [Pirellulales bacterium]